MQILITIFTKHSAQRILYNRSTEFISVSVQGRLGYFSLIYFLFFLVLKCTKIIGEGSDVLIVIINNRVDRNDDNEEYNGEDQGVPKLDAR